MMTVMVDDTSKHIDGREKLRVRLKYKANMETVDVPVDCKMGLGGLLP